MIKTTNYRYADLQGFIHFSGQAMRKEEMKKTVTRKIEGKRDRGRKG